jgi:hypothetical protein
LIRLPNSNTRMGLERASRARSWAALEALKDRDYPGIRLEELWKTTIRIADVRIEPTSTECEAKVLTT